MYELSKKKPERFLYGLESEIREDPKKGKDLLKKVEADIHELKKTLRTGVKEEEFDHLGVLLHGFVAMQKVLKRMVKP